MTILRVGTNPKYEEGWAAAFGKAKPARAAKASKKKAPGKKASRKKK